MTSASYPFFDAIALVIYETAWKGAVVLIVCAAVERFFYRGSAATHHAIWTSAMAVLIALPIAEAAIPKIHVWLPKIDGAAIMTGNVTAPNPPLIDVEESYPAAVGAPILDVSNEQPVQHRSRATHSSIIVSIWGAGTMLCILHYLIGHLLVWRIRSISRIASDTALLSAYEGVRAEADLKRRISLRIGGTAAPMTWGLLRSTILLPEEAAGWPFEKTRVVLLHELAHIKRRDTATHGLARLACALQWPNPLAWYGLLRMQRLREMACDDFVIRHGSAPAEYAGYLVEIVKTLRDRMTSPAGALAISRSPRIEMRIRRILDATTNRAYMTRRAALGTLCFAAAGLLFTAGLRVANAEDRYVARTASGEGLALFAVGDASSNLAAWWGPDGEPLPGDQMEEISNELQRMLGIGNVNRSPGSHVLLFQLVGVQGDPLVDYDVDFGATFPCSHRFLRNYGGAIGNCFVFFGEATDDASTADMTLSVNREPWETILDRDGWGGEMRTSDDGNEIAFMGHAPAHGGLMATVMHWSSPDKMIRAALIDDTGDTHVAYPSETLGTKPRLESFQWPDLRTRDIAGFRVEIRSRYDAIETATISGIPLAPRQR